MACKHDGSKTKRSRIWDLYENKLYRTPPTPTPEQLAKREKGFVLDGVAVSNISHDYGRCNPKVGSAIPEYDAQKDPCAVRYFETSCVRRGLPKTGQEPPGTCAEGASVERFAPADYLRRRNVWGCGRSTEVAGGHGSGVFGPMTLRSYNGEFGYRRNTPKLRNTPSSFGVVTDLPLH
ncbi:unnamed protein product [Dicrocoelium dendriticum]|nr:unnamed protein product [Dicrocoelium dendriticum]